MIYQIEYKKGYGVLNNRNGERRQRTEEEGARRLKRTRPRLRSNFEERDVCNGGDEVDERARTRRRCEVQGAAEAAAAPRGEGGEEKHARRAGATGILFVRLLVCRC